jgi:phosphohistidine swiveling domain-containing protein
MGAQPDFANLDNIFKNNSELLQFRKKLKPMLIDEKYDVAIRSSATLEDSYSDSYAGHFSTFIGKMSFEEVLINIKKVIKSLNNVQSKIPTKMGVIVQKRIDASFSGVSFSSNPINASKSECVISVIEGMGSGLVSGRTRGEDIVIVLNEESYILPPYESRISQTILKEICLISKKIENQLNHPMDIEWCVDKKTKKIYILQCRPATGIFFKDNPVMQINLENEKKIPPYIASNEKVNLRLIGERHGILVSRAYLVFVNGKGNPIITPDLSLITPTPNYSGYSAVLIFPNKISGKVVRSFFGQNTQIVRNELIACHRYCIRSYPEHSTLSECIVAISSLCFEHHWLAIIIVQEIFAPRFTGVIKKIANGFMIELAQGHFIPKGLVPTSQYIVDLNGEIVFTNEISQDKCVKIVEGIIFEEKIDPDDTLVSVSKNTLLRIIDDFKIFMKNEQVVVEFGLLEDFENDQLCPYLIDFVQDESNKNLDLLSVSEGILSKGIITGNLINYKESIESKDVFDFHFHDDIENKPSENDSFIFLCEKPDISLLKVINRYNPQKIGFIFREGSMLCHLAIILRERNIPGIIVENLDDILSGEQLTLDANSLGLKGKERVIQYGKQK